MSSPLIKTAYKLNQALSIPYFLNAISWDSQSEAFHREPKRWKRFSHCIIAFGLIIPSFSVVLGMRLVAQLLHPGSPSPQEQIVLLLMFAFLLYSVPIELMMFQDSEIMTRNTNQHFHFERRNCQDGNKNKGNTPNKKIISKDPDWIGLLLVGFVLTLTPSCITIPIFLGLKNLDPFYFGMFGIEPAIETNIQIPIFVKMFRLSLQCVIFVFGFETIRTMAVILVGNVVIARKNLQRVSEMEFGRRSIFMYRQLQIVFKMGSEFHKDGTKYTLSFACINFVLFITIAATQWNRLNIFVVAFLIMVSVTTMGFITIGINYLVDYYEISNKCLANWRTQAAYERESTGRAAIDLKCSRKTLRSLRFIASPIGNVGIIDMDLKTNYFKNTLDFTINAIMAMSEN